MRCDPMDKRGTDEPGSAQLQWVIYEAAIVLGLILPVCDPIRNRNAGESLFVRVFFPSLRFDGLLCSASPFLNFCLKLECPE